MTAARRPTLKTTFREVPKTEAPATEPKASRLRAFAARAARAAQSDNAKVGYIATAFAVGCIAVHAAQVAITKKILFS